VTSWPSDSLLKFPVTLALTSERLVWANDWVNDKDANNKAATTRPTFLNLTFLSIGLLTAMICKSAALHCVALQQRSAWRNYGDASVMPGLWEDAVKIASTARKILYLWRWKKRGASELGAFLQATQKKLAKPRGWGETKISRRL